MSFYAKLFLLFILLTSLFIFPQKSSASSYYFYDEFNTNLPPNSLDPTKWTVFPNNRPGFNTIRTDGNYMITTQENNTYRYPLIISKNAIPQGDFSFEIKFQYTNVTMWGTGLNLSENKPLEDGTYTSNFNIGVWQDKYLSNMRIHVNDVDIFSIPNNINSHILLVEKSNKKHKIFLDGNLIYTASNIPVDLNYLWLGNPLILDAPVPWTKFKVDYVRVQSFSPQPFLDLPWDYSKDGKSFDDTALAINSFFDHTYPFLSVGRSLSEPVEDQNTTTIFVGSYRVPSPPVWYSSHDGYDYGADSGAHLYDPVLTAASGYASYTNSCSACGNMIMIDHQNGYQTRYMHLHDDGLITKTAGEKVWVNSGDQIGKVGFTGRTFPPGEDGAHIHFGVYQDKNGDGNFNDNIPDGATDPYGWQDTTPDPWANYSFFYNGQQRTGNSSYYLWKQKLSGLDATLTSNGGVFNAGRYTLNFPANVTSQNINIRAKAAPVMTILNNLKSIGSTIIITAYDYSGNLVDSFLNPFTLVVDFSSFIQDLDKFKASTISFYSTTDGINWIKENTTVDWEHKIASTQVSHLSQFALVAEKADITPPNTIATITGLGNNNWFRSNVNVTLSATDEALGTDFTIYKINGGEWQLYKDPLVFSQEDNYKLEFYSYDKDDNAEETKTIEFNIDKTAPQVILNASPALLWPPNGKMVDIKVLGSASDNNHYTKAFSINDEYGQVTPALTDFGQTIQLEARRDGNDLDGRVYTIKVIAEDLAGNITEKSTLVTVPHDQRK